MFNGYGLFANQDPSTDFATVEEAGARREEGVAFPGGREINGSIWRTEIFYKCIRKFKLASSKCFECL
jgi:hypothetical protein